MNTIIDFTKAKTELTHNGWNTCGKYLTIKSLQLGKCQTCGLSINKKGITSLTDCEGRNEI